MFRSAHHARSQVAVCFCFRPFRPPLPCHHREKHQEQATSYSVPLNGSSLCGVLLIVKWVVRDKSARWGADKKWRRTSRGARSFISSFISIPHLQIISVKLNLSKPAITITLNNSENYHSVAFSNPIFSLFKMRCAKRQASKPAFLYSLDLSTSQYEDLIFNQSEVGQSIC
jgi:hypothetical protein